MMVRCPLCRRVLTERDRLLGRCAACGQSVPASVRLGASGGGLGSGVWWGQGRWAGWAAGFGLLAPAAILVLDRLLQRQAMADPALVEQMRPWLGAALLLMVLALVGAGAALIEGVRRRAWRAAFCAGLALVANGLLLAAWAAGNLFKSP